MTTLNLPPIIPRKLRDLRVSVMSWFLADGLSRLLIAITVLALVSLGIDRLFRLDLAQRLLILLSMLAVLGWVIWRYLIRPLRTVLDDDQLALQVETRHPELGDALVSALQLSRVTDPDRHGASAALIARTVEEGGRRTEHLQVTDVIDRDARNRAMLWGGAALVVLAVLVGLLPGTFATWAQRNIMLSNAEWPQETYLQVIGLNEDGKLYSPRGDDLEIRVGLDPNPPATVDGQPNVMPESVTIEYDMPGEPTRRQQMSQREDIFVAQFPNVIQPFKFRVRGNDDVTDWYELVLVPRPSPEELRLTVTPPDYTGEQPYDLQLGRSSFPILAGSSLAINGRANKPLASAGLLFKTQPFINATVGGANNADFNVTIAADQLESGTYGLTMTDTEGLDIRRPVRFTVRKTPDRQPSVRVALRGVSDLITTRAVIPLEVNVRDDYAVTDIGLVHEAAATVDDQQFASEPTRVEVEDIDQKLPAQDPEPFTHRFDTESLGNPPDSTLTIYLEVTDNDELTGPKTTQSASLSFRVVRDEELRERLLARESAQRRRFEQLVELQEDIRVDTEALLATLRAGEELTSSQQRVLARLEGRQRKLASRADGALAVSRAYAHILEEVLNNRLDDGTGEYQTRLELRVIRPVEQLAEGLIPQAADQLNLAAKPILDPAERGLYLANAVQQQKQALQVMATILENMLKTERFHEAINMLQEIRRAQEEVRKLTEEEKEDEIQGGGIFDP